MWEIGQVKIDLGESSEVQFLAYTLLGVCTHVSPHTILEGGRGS